jgi:hypothetical protein
MNSRLRRRGGRSGGVILREHTLGQRVARGEGLRIGILDGAQQRRGGRESWAHV